MELRVIARMKSDFPTKFGIPRQSGLVEETVGRIVFEKEYAVPAAVKGITGYSHIWILWGFSEAEREGWSPTVRPPRLGGNQRVGVFASRSPFRPNPIGLSCVKLLSVSTENGVTLTVAGADLMDGTPIYDIKPYLPFADARPDAVGGFADRVKENRLRVVFGEGTCEDMEDALKTALTGILEEDPRPHYQNDPERIYGFPYAGWEIRFRVEGNILTVAETVKNK